MNGKAIFDAEEKYGIITQVVDENRRKYGSISSLENY
jgi:hypothetical protein